MLVILVGAVAFHFSGPKTTGELPPPKSAEQQAAEARAAQTKKAREENAAIGALALKSSLRDPDSLVIEAFLSNDDATTVCIAYRAKNGFGGMNREAIVIIDGKVKKDAATWNKTCTQSLNDMMYVVKQAKK